MIGRQVNERYLLEAELGRGGMGVVYRARDSLLKRDVALKVLAAGDLGTEGRSRLLQEARAAASLNHVNIVAVYDVGEISGPDEAAVTSFIVMELVKGASLRQAGIDSTAELIDIATQICAALEEAHSQGIIHRDLKPENVIVTPAGTVKLLDFGLARVTGQTRLTQEGALSGTLSYLAPEIILGGQASPRSDLYALGVILYELAAGQPPFTGDNLTAVLSQHLYAPVVPPSVYNAELAPALERLIISLLAKEPAERPESAALVAQSLAEGTAAGESPELLSYSVIQRLVRGKLTGRGEEFARAVTVWQRASSGNGHVLLISGEPGIGKTRFARELVTFAEIDRATVLTGECYAEGGQPYDPVGQMVRTALSNGLSQELPEVVLADLLTLAPDLKHQFAEVPENPPLDPEAEQQRLFESAVVLALELVRQAPLLLILEDAHWADEGSLALVRHLARRLRRRALLILATYREVELTEARPLHELLLSLQREHLATRVKLARLSREQTGSMLAGLFSEEITSEFLEGIYRETEGNPFFIEEVCKALVESGELYFEDGIWHRPQMEELAIPQSLTLAIQARVGKLPQQSQDILRLAAVIGREFDFDTLASASGLAEDNLIDALEVAEQAEIVVEMSGRRGGTFAFAHALFPLTLKESLTGLRLRRLHRTVAESIEALRPDDTAALAYHFSQAEVEARAIFYLRQAAEASRARYANEDAIRSYSKALEFAEAPDGERFDLLAARAGVNELLARREEQLADVEEMLELAISLGDEGRRVEALLALSDYYLVTENEKALEPAQQGLALARTLGEKRWEARALRRLGDQAYQRWDLPPARKALEDSVTLFRESGLEQDAARCLISLAGVLRVSQAFDQSVAVAEEARRIASDLGDRRLEADSLRKLSATQQEFGKRDEALASLERAAKLSRDIGDKAGEAHCLNVMGILASDIDQTESYYVEALTMAEALGMSTLIVFLHNNMQLGVFRPRGAYESGILFMQAQTEKARLSDDEQALMSAVYWLAVLQSLMGEYREAVTNLQNILPRVGEVFSPGVRATTLGFLSFYQASLGQWPEANEYLALSRQIIREQGDKRWPALVSWGRLALLAREPETLRQALAEMDLLVAQTRGELSSDDLAEVLVVRAELHMAQYEASSKPGELKAAVADLEQVLDITARNTDASALEEYYFTYSQALRLAERHEEADEYLGRALERVMLVAANTRDKRRRRSWLENVPMNRALIQAARERNLAAELTIVEGDQEMGGFEV